jgi:DeoR/GlpR family transcriptional regulator of sugar metabolism
MGVPVAGCRTTVAAVEVHVGEGDCVACGVGSTTTVEGSVLTSEEVTVVTTGVVIFSSAI